MTHIFEIVLDISIGAGILALLILVARSIIGRKRVVLMPVLFALLIVKLIFPLSIESPLSIQNLMNLQNAQPIAAETHAETPVAATDNDTTIQNMQASTQVTSDAAAAVTYKPPETTLSVPATTATQVWQPSLMDIAAIVWLSGILALTVFISVCNIRFTLLLRRNRAYAAPGFDALLTSCKKAFGIRQRIHVIQVSEINTAAVYGIFKRKLLISPDTFNRLSSAEKRHVLMHELSHIKRRDTLTCLIITALNVVYWFNPIIWIAFILMRKDLEVLCDAGVLKKIGQSEKRSYATTLLNLIKANRKKSVRHTAALFMHRTNIKRRIVMISKYKRSAPMYTALALVLTVVIAVTGCTTGVTESKDTTDEQPQTEQTEQTERIAAEQEPPPTEQTETADGELIRSYSLDISNYADDEDRLYNIEKAAMLYDGTILAPGEKFDLIAPALPISSWQIAPMFDWYDAAEFPSYDDPKKQAEVLNNAEYTDQVAGGLELVVFSLLATTPKGDTTTQGTCTVRSSTNFVENEADLTNNLDKPIIIQTRIEDNKIIVNFYCSDTTVLDQQQEEQPVEPVLMTSYQVDYSDHKTANGYYNVEKAANVLNGTVIRPGQELSLNDILGARNKANGWKKTGGISGGAYTSQYGGGISAVSSGLYNAAIRAELEILEKANHSIISDYITLGLDATISNGKPDLVIKNPYDIDVAIESSFKDGIVTINIYGPPRDYTVDFTSMKTGTTPPAETIYHYNATATPDGAPIGPGDSVTYVKSSAGSIYEIYKTQYDLDGNEIKTSPFETVTYRYYTGQIYVNAPDPATPVSTPTPVSIQE